MVARPEGKWSTLHSVTKVHHTIKSFLVGYTDEGGMNGLAYQPCTIKQFDFTYNEKCNMQLDK